MRTEIEIPDEVTATMDHLEVTVEGPNGSVTRRLWYPDITVDVEDGAVVIETDDDNAKTRSTVGTFESHVTNMFHGVTEGWEYSMEVFYSHFPMQVSVEGGDIVIENFLGEKAPRKTPVRGDTSVEVDGEELTVSGPSIEDVGQTAADIEQLTRVSDKDTRVFQDGVYITETPDRGDV
ncbi:50S ribosomal protein L6 [Natronomonas pharaonis DSM 2160]|uniref:Large ribosomal subunit protein uL6 n=1 Tax=Natronomonas pharaonis (strain ATCC 35678 / DSM 2160 / CIP 103997 / JCM 8858 / NBRC 14720 / NCIMB 2260 / Gabara) TaxID=348780 RepID=RL6_NATPD|nr:50S ribosomal protein L6 [Natronomonas pharaonis]Q3IMX2.1 RecName: Full=Large ribosomal subunit protein uL6; AltName: Full=50S ribosomal protein L6 [Natronomonas pharaonis DSM 2160]CAI50534.1 50S ribosomal protein L6 [Natronomonas pharaonis DSM 2160]